jgi:hypothetical protein
VSKILKMPKHFAKARKGDPHSPTRREPSAPLVSKTSPAAEIVLFPNGKDRILRAAEVETDPQTKTRWLKLADKALEKGEDRKKA